MFRVARKIRVGCETGNTHIFFFGLMQTSRKKHSTPSNKDNGKDGIIKWWQLASPNSAQ